MAIFVVASFVVLGHTGTGKAAVSHTCSATDRQFLGARS